MQITAIEIAIDHLLDIWPPESVLPGEMLIIDPDEGPPICQGEGGRRPDEGRHLK